MDVEVIPDWNSLIEMKHEKRVERKIEIASLHIKQKCAVNNEGGGFFLLCCAFPDGRINNMHKNWGEYALQFQRRLIN